jgi:hypothetical protein
VRPGVLIEPSGFIGVTMATTFVPKRSAAVMGSIVVDDDHCGLAMGFCRY